MTKKEQTEINKVLDRGQFFINFPVMFVMFGLAYLVFYLRQAELISNIVSIIGYVVSFISGWLVWSLFIARWRIWAFEKIDEKFHAYLKKEAINAKMIWPDGHVFEKTEIRSSAQKIKIKAINDRIDKLKEI